ncbi:alkanesulfonate transporter permease subunit [Cylindrospermopsis raciborskii S07]|jgi:sulfonate transport system permease protein|uniref:Aliphatic sulfonate ABC transporter permease SsuC n=4 Tax=Cylindrospermopsis TaxID=77021 RepID=A0A7H0EX46_9CYAN|nr:MULTISPECIES: aliphatic sulfonate ABC transporter permease SsuC [Cylindrospermopsis]EFA69065.1 Binding-protein-dependent transport systems inner membrane component [Cylindrospermopsis raciborskii CS-505]MBA4446073.1 aliphatic sulfonate ABC transporter permease SsuC [Cylindrospermopsis raciborskii CS-506_C]MBA4450303.1 aliphatic sulfonate ABC transporter permease SsuC [Cylindrospermopsis raciborskii CS-506_D]MBA4456929.1 aliphatic sulfonate ABC transporter permease SsuC [Cylindrospermopsis ra
MVKINSVEIRDIPSKYAFRKNRSFSRLVKQLIKNSYVQSIIPWLVPGLIITIWQLLSSLGVIPNRILPAPLAVIAAAIKMGASGELFRNIGISAARAISGFLLGGSIGFSLGLINGIWPIAEKLIDTSIQMLRNIPNLALIPLVILWFGIGDEARLFLVSLGVMFPIYLNTFHGIRSVDPGLIEMGRIYGLTPWGLFWRIILPGAMSSILVGVRFSLGIMWLTLIVAETIAADSGIGYMAMNAREFMQTDVVVLSILIYACFGKLADVIAKSLERYWLQWNPGYFKN